MNCRVSGLPAADEASAMLFAMAVTYLATLPVTDHSSVAGRIEHDAEARAPRIRR